LRKNGKNNLRNALKHALIIGTGAFFLAVIASFASQVLIERLTSIILGFVLLVIIILIGIIFDIIGIAAATSKEVPLHCRSSKKVFGTNQAIKLVRNADQVSSFCNDVVGDVSGTLSGAIGAALVFRLLQYPSETIILVAGTLMTSFIASLIVAGKAFGKTFAINNGTEIVFRVGQVLAWFEEKLHFNLFENSNGLEAKQRRGRKK
jgi:CBS domain containing-hemolysin-like protein